MMSLFRWILRVFDPHRRSEERRALEERRQLDLTISESYTSLLEIENPEEFVRAAYARVLGRPHQNHEVVVQVRALEHLAREARRELLRGMLSSEEVALRNRLRRESRPVTVPFEVGGFLPKDRSYPSVAICSLFRDMEPHIERLKVMVEHLDYPKERVRFVFMEGGSRDRSRDRLLQWAKQDERVTVEPEPVPTPSVGSAEPFPALAESANRVLDLALPGSDYVLWMESDLIYPRDILLLLLRHEKPIVAPMVYLEGTSFFYDTWAFRKGSDPSLGGPNRAVGCFQSAPPYHPCYRPHALFEVDSAGSVLMICREVLDAGVRFSPNDVIVGLCAEARNRGFHVYVDPNAYVYHPLPWSPSAADQDSTKAHEDGHA